jgi:hypothetical protein
MNPGEVYIPKENFLEAISSFKIEDGEALARTFSHNRRSPKSPVCFTDFILGLVITSYSNWEDKVKFIFRLFLLSKESSLNKTEFDICAESAVHSMAYLVGNGCLIRRPNSHLSRLLLSLTPVAWGKSLLKPLQGGLPIVMT